MFNQSQIHRVTNVFVTICAGNMHHFPGETQFISNKPSVWIALQASNTVTKLHLSTNDSRLPAG